MTDVATALKWAREFGLGPNSPAQVLADALETAERHGDEWQEKGLELYGELYAALDALRRVAADLREEGYVRDVTLELVTDLLAGSEPTEAKTEKTARTVKRCAFYSESDMCPPEDGVDYCVNPTVCTTTCLYHEASA